jgi:hypothetical protein
MHSSRTDGSQSQEEDDQQAATDVRWKGGAFFPLLTHRKEEAPTQGEMEAIHY